jgi:hypothetical protein
MAYRLTRLVAAVVAAVATVGGGAPAEASGDAHSCPSGFKAEQARTPEEKRNDDNGDGTVCVKETDDGTEIRDDTH